MAITKIDGTRQLRFSGDLDLATNKITNVATPENANDAANKTYVDSVAQGLSLKESVRVATTTNGTFASAFANGQTVDGITLATNDRILIKDQTDATKNGIYVVAVSGAPSRAEDMDSGSEVSSAFCFVREGTANADKGFVCINNVAPTLGTDNISFAQFSSVTLANNSVNENHLTTSVAGEGLAGGNGTPLSVNVDGTTIEITGDDLNVAAGGITETHLATSVAGNGLAGGGGTALSVNVDGTTIEITGDSLNVKAGGITGTHLTTSVAGDGLAGGNGTALSVNVDSSTIEITGDSLNVKAGGITGTHLTTSIAGNGLAGGGGTALSVNVDSSTIEINSDSLRVKSAGITETHLATSVAGSGLAGGGGTALSVNVDGTTIEITGDSLNVKAGGITGDYLDLMKESTSGVLSSNNWVLSNKPTSDNCLFIFRNGQFLIESDDYTRSGPTITFVDQTQSYDKFVAVYMQGELFADPPANPPSIIDPNVTGIIIDGSGVSAQIINVSGQNSYYLFTLSDYIADATSYTVITTSDASLHGTIINSGIWTQLKVEWFTGELPYRQFTATVRATNDAGYIDVVFAVFNA